MDKQLKVELTTVAMILIFIFILGTAGVFDSKVQKVPTDIIVLPVEPLGYADYDWTKKYIPPEHGLYPYLRLPGKWKDVCICLENRIPFHSVRFRVRDKLDHSVNLQEVRSIIENYFYGYDVEFREHTVRYQGTYNSTYTRTTLQFMVMKYY